MRKVTIAGMMILAVILTGCSKQSTDERKAGNNYGAVTDDERKSANVYSPLSTQKTESDYQMEGTVYLSGERSLVNIRAIAETEITLAGILEKKEGEIRLFYEDADGNTATLADSKDSDEKTIDVNLSLSLKEGDGKIYFSGESCIYDFALNISLQDGVDYFFNNMTSDYTTSGTVELEEGITKETAEHGDHAAGDTENLEDEINKIDDEMNRIIEEIGLENAADYNDGMEDIAKDRIILLCESPDGRFQAYGFISPAYGKQGILINNIINGEDNHNYFYEKWVYSDERPSFIASDDFYQVTFTICQDEAEGMKEIHFYTYDTGTMDPEEW